MPRIDPIRSRRRLKRLSLIGVVLVLLIGGLGALYAYQTSKRVVQADELIAEARAAYAEQRYEAVVELLERPDARTSTLREIQNDPELLYLYVDARRQVPLPNGEHYLRLFPALQQCVRLDPGNLKAGRELLELLLLRGMYNDAVLVATELVKAHPDDPEAHRFLGQAHLRLDKPDKARESFIKARDLEPMQVQTQYVIAKLLRDEGGDTAEYVEQAQRLLDEHPDDPRAEVIRAFGYMLDRNNALAQDMLLRAAERPAPDDAFIRVMVNQLDIAGLFAQAQAYLVREAGEGVGTLAGEEALLRAYDTGNYQAVLDRLASANAREVAPDILAAWVIASEKIGDKAASARLIEEMADRDDPTALAWSVVLPLAVDAQTPPGKLIDALGKLLSADPGMLTDAVRLNPYLNQMLGEAYMRMDEPEAAIRVMRVAAEQRLSWHRPRQLMAEILLDQGRPAEAYEQARQAYDRLPTIQTAPLRAAAQLAATDPADTNAVDRAIAQADELLRQLPDEPRTLTHTIALLVNAGRTVEAQRRLGDALAMDPPLPRQALVDLARIASAPALGMADAVYAKLNQAYGASPESVAAEARDLADAGRADEGLALIDRTAPTEPTLDWRLARAQYLAYTGDASAGQAWITLADAYPNNIEVQQLALSVTQARADRAFVDRAVGRLRTLGGESALGWRIEQARTLMERDPGTEQLREAARLLNEVLQPAPDRVEALVLLARAQAALGDLAAAERTARSAMAADDRSPGVRMIFGQVLHAQRRYNESRAPLIAVARDERADRRLRLTACGLLVDQNERRVVIEVLESMRQAGEAQTPELVLLARQYALAGDVGRADVVCEELLARPTVDGIDFVAAYYDQTERRAKADEATALLASVQAGPADRNTVLGRAAARRGDLAQALSLLLSAAEAEPTRALHWQRVVEIALAMNKPSQAVQYAARGINAAGGDPGLVAVRDASGVLGLIEQDPALVPLVIALLNEPTNRGAARQALDQIQRDARAKTPPAESAEHLAALADRHDGFLALNLLAVQRLLDASADRRAAEIATRAMENFPNSGDAAKGATLAGYRLSDWPLVLSAAPEWAKRNPSDKPQADVLRATALNMVNRFEQAAALLAPYIRPAGEDIDANPAFYNEYTRAVVRMGKPDQAWAVLAPKLPTSATARDFAMRRVASDLPTAAMANRWLADTRAVSDEDNLLDQLLLGQGALRAGQRFNDSDLLRQARAHLDRAVSLGAQTPIDAHLLRAEASEALGDLQTAEQSYLAALRIAPGNPTLMNNLAMVVAHRDASRLAEAEDLATRATAGDPKDPNLLDTLALIRLKRGNRDGALQAIDKAIALDPATPTWRLTRADVLEAMGKTEQANDIRQRFGGLPGN